MTTFWSLFWLSVLLVGLTSIGCGIGYGLAKPGKPEAAAKPSKMDLHLLSSTNNGTLVYTDIEVNVTSIFKGGIWLEYGALNAYLQWGACRVSKTVTLPPPPPERLHARQQSWTIAFKDSFKPIGAEGVALPTDGSMVRLVVRSPVRWKLRKIFIKKRRSTVNFHCPLQLAGAPCEVGYD